MTKSRQFTKGEGILPALTALFLCFLFVLNARDAGHAVRLVSVESGEASGITSSTQASAAPMGTGASAAADSGEETADAGKVDLNTASVEELETLPGIGPALAERIAAYRAEHGPFSSIEAVTEVSGIGPGKFSAMEPYLYVSAGAGP